MLFRTNSGSSHSPQLDRTVFAKETEPRLAEQSADLTASPDGRMLAMADPEFGRLVFLTLLDDLRDSSDVGMSYTSESPYAVSLYMFFMMVVIFTTLG